MLQEIKTLVQTLNEQRDAYYNKDSPKMTDKEYDRLFDRLEELEKKSGIIFSNSPTQSVGYYPVSELAKVRHTRALLSLEKTKQIRELADFMENQDTLLMLKLDGLTVKLVYEEGRLVQASTRGDGNVGEDITHNIPAFENVPLSISYRERLVTTGEAFIYKDDFRQLKDTIRDGNGEPYKNARNLASGSVRNLNPEVCKGRHVHFIPFNVLEGMDEGTGVDSREFKLMQLGVLGFDTCPYVYMEAGKHSEKELKEQIEKLKTVASEKGIPIDGLVLIYDNLSYSFKCGKTGHHYKDGLTLYVELTGLYGSDCYKKAYHEIQKKLDLGAGEQMEKRLEIQCRKKKQKESLAKPVDYKRRDHTYRELLTLLQLSPQHRKDLLSRGLTETEVANMEALGYKSTCAEESVAIARKLLKRGCRLEGVPGFFMNYHGDWEIAFYQKNNGYLCPVWSDEGLLIAFQIRLDVPYQKRKYVWLSSAKMEKGCSPGSPVSFSGVLNSPVIYVTEGVLKAEAAYQRTGHPYLGNPGVSAYKELELALNRLKAHGVKVVIEANDMDKCIRLHCDRAYSEACADCEGSSHECPKKREKRDHIRKGCLKLYEICEKLGLICKRAVWDTDDEGYWEENYKGIDDWELREL